MAQKIKMVQYMEGSAIRNCNEAQKLISLSESVDALLSDSDTQSNLSEAIFKVTSKILSSDDVTSIRNAGGHCQKSAFVFPESSSPDINLLLALKLRPVNELAKKLYHQPLLKIVADSKNICVSNFDQTALLKISKKQDKWDVIQINSMNDSTTHFEFDSVENIFEQFLYEFYVLVNRNQVSVLLDDFQAISIERKTRPSLIEKSRIPNVS